MTGVQTCALPIFEGPPGESAGLGLLEIETHMTPEKRLTETTARDAETGTPFRGYEIHIGRTLGPDCTRPFAHADDRPEGARSADGLVMGSYLHGMFRDDAFRAAFLARLGARSSDLDYSQSVEDTLDALARHLEAHLDVHRLLATAS